MTESIFGQMAEWLIAQVWKTGVLLYCGTEDSNSSLSVLMDNRFSGDIRRLEIVALTKNQ